MTARRLTPDADSRSLTLGPVAAGELLFSAAVEGTGAQAVIDLEPGGGDECIVAGDPPRWHPCRLALGRATSHAKLRLRLRGAPAGSVVVSSPLLRAADATRRPLVIVVLADTLRFDHLASYVPTISLGVHLDALARQGVVFERAYSSTSWTRPAVATLLTGLDAATHGTLDRTDVLPPQRDGLPQALQRAGYRTFAWSTNPNILPMWGFGPGFDVFQDVGAWKWPKEKVDAGAVLAAVRTALAEPDPGPAFHYVHLMDPHGPYQPAPSDLAAVDADATLRSTYPGRERTASALEEHRRYLGEILGMDRELGSFFDDLRARGLYDDAAILVVADHGEEFLDHGDMRHGKTLYEEMVRVPMILKLPGNALAGTRIRSEVGLVDVAPTLLSVLGLAGLPDADGRNLWDPTTHALRDEPAPQSAVLKLDAHHMVALVTGLKKLIVDYRDDEEMYDLGTDPREARNLLPQAEQDAAAMRGLLDGRIARREAGWHVRACGADQATDVDLRVDVRGEAHGTMLEDGDAVTIAARRGTETAYRVQLRLAPQQRHREKLGRLTEEVHRDEDEMTVPSPDDGVITVASLSGRPFRYALGAEQRLTESLELAVPTSDPAARLRPSDVAECRPPGATSIPTSPSPPSDAQSYIRIWYVPAVEQRPPGAIDPAVQDRLRALGYH